jgi:Leucine-rich repeat (LRR) protein
MNKTERLRRLITDNPNVKHLGLYKLYLKTIPQIIGNFTQLESLDGSNNNFTEFPSPIFSFRLLMKLNLRFNHITIVPPNIEILINIRQLDLSYNQLSSLPDSIGNLTSLTELQLDNNQLSSLPHTIGNLTSLMKLYLNDNHLTRFPSQIPQLINSLFICNNRISWISRDIIINYRQLQRLEFDFRIITTWDFPDVLKMGYLCGYPIDVVNYWAQSKLSSPISCIIV